MAACVPACVSVPPGCGGAAMLRTARRRPEPAGAAADRDSGWLGGRSGTTAWQCVMNSLISEVHLQEPVWTLALQRDV